MKKTILYIHGFNGNPQGGTYQGLVDFFSDKNDYEVISYPFPALHTDVEKTQKQIENYIEQNNVSILVGASLGGFYTLCCKKPVFKIAINPCMIPSKEIPMLTDRETGAPVQIAENVISNWLKLEEFNLHDEQKQAFGIFGLQDKTFHYNENHNFKPLFEKVFNNHTALIPGEHSLTTEQLKQGLEQVMNLLP